MRASRTAVGEPSAARTLRRAGAGAGGTCSGMVGRLSLRETRWSGGRCGRRCQRSGSEGGRCRGQGRGANSLPRLRSLYDTCSHSVSASCSAHCGKARIRSPLTWRFMPDFARTCRADLGITVTGRSAGISSAFFTNGQVGAGNCALRSCPVNVPKRAIRPSRQRRARHGHVRAALSITSAWASSSVTRDDQGRSSACPLEEGRFDGGEGRGGRFDLSDRQRYRDEAPAVPGGTGATAGGEAVRPPQESHGAGDRAESRGRRRAAENDECASAGADREPRFPDRTRNVQSGSQHCSAPARRPGFRPARRGAAHRARICRPARRARSTRAS